MTYETLIADNDYEILNQYPFTTRRINNHYIPSETFSHGYVQVILNRKPYRKHRLIAEQFLPNPDNLPEVDHKNRHKTDYHLDNLRWADRSTNQRNRAIYNDDKGNTYEAEYIAYEDAHDDIIYITRYGKHEIDGYAYSFDKDTFYYDTNEAYRILQVRYDHLDYPFVHVRDTNRKKTKLMVNKFKRDNDL